MAILLYMPDGVAFTAQQERQAKAALYGGGANRPLGGRSGFRVDTPANVLTVTTTSWTLLPCSAMIDPGATTHQGMYGWASDANITQASIPNTPTPPDATLPRKDIYYIQVSDSTSGDGSGAVSAPVQYLAGTPNATPTAPTLPARSFLIATVTVPQNGGGNPTVVLNPARFAAAGGILPVGSDAEALALVQSKGLTVSYSDGMTATSNGTSFIERAESVLLAPPDSGWTVVGGLVKTRTHGGLTMVTIAARVTRTASGGTFPIGAGFTTLLTSFIPSGWRPTIVTDMRTVVNDGAAAGQTEPVVRVGTDGTIAMRPAQGYAAVTGQANWFFHLQGSWYM